MWSWGCPTLAQKWLKNTKNPFFPCFRPYVGQPHSHIGWAKSMPFTSINPTNPRTDPWNFHEKILRIGGAGKWGFFEAAILNFLSRPFWIFFLLHLCEKSSHFIWGIIFFCTMDSFSRILEKKLSELLCTRLYMFNFSINSHNNVVFTIYVKKFPSTLIIDLILWHAQLIVYAVKC